MHSLVGVRIFAFCKMVVQEKKKEKWEKERRNPRGDRYLDLFLSVFLLSRSMVPRRSVHPPKEEGKELGRKKSRSKRLPSDAKGTWTTLILQYDKGGGARDYKSRAI